MISKEKWPKNQTHFQMIDHMEKILENQNKWLYSNKLAEKISEQYDGISRPTARAYLSTYRDYLTEQEPFTAEELPDGTSGVTTVYWKHDNQEVHGKVKPSDD